MSVGAAGAPRAGLTVAFGSVPYLGAVLLDQIDVLVVALGLLLLLNGGDDAPGRAAGADHVLVADAEQVTLLDLLGVAQRESGGRVSLVFEASSARRGCETGRRVDGRDRGARERWIVPPGLKARDRGDLTHEATADGQKPAELSRPPASRAPQAPAG